MPILRYLDSRTGILLAIVWVAVIGAYTVMDRSANRQLQSAADVQMQSNHEVWNLIHELADKSIVNAVADYTFWDDMAEFAEGARDIQWARDNLDPGLSSFDLDMLWVYDADGVLRYSVMIDGNTLKTPPPLPLDRAAMEVLVAGTDEDYGVMHEFYWFSDIGPLTVIGSDITSTDDPEHLKPARGYYFVASILTMDHSLVHLRDIEASGVAMPMTSLPSEEPPTVATPHVFWHRMQDHTDATIGAIRIERENALFSALLKNSDTNRLISTGLWIVTGIALSFLVISLSRVQRRANDLAEQMTRQLLEANVTLERTVAERTKELADDIAQRKLFEAQLEKRTRDLETMNRAMLDRESRVVELKHEVEALKKSQQPS